MRVDVEDLIRLEREVTDRANALASRARRALVTRQNGWGNVEAAARALLQAREILRSALEAWQESDRKAA